MNLPTNTALPFFAYGLFKPGQICFPRIREFVLEYIDATVSGTLKERDGIPLLDKSDYFKIKGNLIYFNPEKEVDAYKSIIEIEPDEVYKWSEINANGNLTANVLIGRRSNRGSNTGTNLFIMAQVQVEDAIEDLGFQIYM